ncbi:MAG: AAA family ATPase [Candidatus Eremiobacteraeota bacterium]|nr:AAA family ATPase [Candidatus Eremiobacteraeota bacterium]MBC5802473.1 AAA family ATPase [Candidatus Eremiobacteraeota bacterium]MBC5822542.1 AAA family ATPase [Candidatus Eremiobacteraeota bacterium]
MAVKAESVSSHWELTQLLDIFPLPIRQALVRLPNLEALIEVVLDLGRPPEARFPDDFVFLAETNVTFEDLAHVSARLSAFGSDNRAGIEQTLHRVSAIRNRAGKIVGLTCRVGRALVGTVDIILDVVRSGTSICLLGAPGVGKTTILRECARVLSDDRKRVVIVDTSNEIGGDGDIPHPGIGHARRMQVADAALQHNVMVEAVENHMPEVIVIDEIGTEAEASAAGTIAERGVQLIGTAHGRTLENLLMNPTLSDLVGGISTVTLSDEEARRRGTRKTVLERKAPPTFDVLIEINDRNRLSIYQNVAETVDALLRGYQPQPEVRLRTSGGVQVLQQAVPIVVSKRTAPAYQRTTAAESEFAAAIGSGELDQRREEREGKHVALFPYGVSRNKIERAVQNLGVNASIARKWDEADVVLTLKSLERKESEKLTSIASENVPIYSIKTNTTAQIMHALKDIFALPSIDTEEVALREASEAIYKVLLDNRPVELTPQTSYVRRMQHQLAEQHRVMSRSTGMEPNRRVLFFRGNDLPYGTGASA